MKSFRNDTAWTPLRFAGPIAMLAIGFAVAIGACASDEDDGVEIESEPTRTTTGGADRAPPATVTATRLTLVRSERGLHLAAGERPVYIFTADTRAQSSACHDDCASAWPPLIHPVAAGADVDSTLISSITRPDGSRQVVYDGWPLYVYVQDDGIGEPAGDGIESFGGTWHLVGLHGEPLHDDSAADTASSAGTAAAALRRAQLQ